MPKTEKDYKRADSKGRVSLGEQFANKMVIVEHLTDTTVSITAGVFIPEDEAWLYTNSQAKSAVLRGIRQARAGEFAESPPDLEADTKFSKRLAN